MTTAEKYRALAVTMRQTAYALKVELEQGSAGLGNPMGLLIAAEMLEREAELLESHT